MSTLSAQLQAFSRALLPPPPLGEGDTFVDDAIAWADRARPDKPHAARRAAALDAYRALRDPLEGYTDVDTVAMESIILPGLRPVGDISGGKITLPRTGEFADLMTND